MISLTEAFLAHGATAYPCGKKKECQALLKEIPELKGVKMFSSVRKTLEKGSRSDFAVKGKLNARSSF